MMRRLSVSRSPLKRLGLIVSVMASSTATLPREAFATESGASPGVGNTAAREGEYRKFHLDLSSLQQMSGPQGSEQFRLTLPLPEGGETEFMLEDSGVLPRELAERFPDIRSLKGFDADGRELRLDISELGAHGVVFDNQGEWSIQPTNTSGKHSGGSGEYLFKRTAARVAPVGAFSWNALRKPRWDGKTGGGSGLPIGNHHREYRLAVAAPSAYTKAFGGTVGRGLASVVEAVNRVNAVFERDLGIHLTLVKDNHRLIFTDPASDPYIAPAGENTWDFARSQNPATLDRLIGSENFDVGHLVDMDAGGGEAEPASVCSDKKAYAYSGVINVAEDGSASLDKDFIDTLIHEIGHQFAADHTFNGCGREGDGPYEPGSGSTIMSYAGECFVLHPDATYAVNRLHDLQKEKDAYFHGKTIEEVRAYVAGHADKCGITRNNPSPPPVIARDGVDSAIFIPARTPFYLEGRATSANPAARLTYAWEQIDLGPEQAEAELLRDTGQGPIFRSFPPTPSGTRIFPRLGAILGEETLGLGEAFPETTRELNFRLTVRDNLGKHASTSFIERKIQVLDTGRAFAVTAPSTGSRWRMGSLQLVRWDVAGTAQSPIACRQVRIDLSLDGGHTYLPTPLRAAAANTGRARVLVPRTSADATQARVRVGCNGNTFFAVSAGNFSIAK